MKKNQKEYDIVENLTYIQKKNDMVADLLSIHNKMFIEVVETKKTNEKKAVVMMRRLFEMEEQFEQLCIEVDDPETFKKYKEGLLMNKYN